jgi:pimeloyl-ACP methyl ester carboxylesterase
VTGPRETHAQPSAIDLAGDPGAPGLVFVHGSRLNRGEWRGQLDRLAPTFRIAAPDLPAHGARRSEAFTMDDAVATVERAIDAVGAPVILVGTSLGGFVAIEVAARLPQRVRGLVLAGASLEPSGPAALAFRLFAFALDVIPDPILDAAHAALFRLRYERRVADAIARGGLASRGAARAVRSIVGPGARQRLTDWAGPDATGRVRRTLLLNGAFDLVFRLGSPGFGAGIPGVSRLTLRGATHLAHLDRPDRFAAAIREFGRALGDDLSASSGR